MTATALRPLLLRILIGALCVAAATAAAALLGGRFDDTDWKVIGTSLLFAVASGTAASGVALRARPEGWAWALGTLTVVASAVTFALVTFGMWGEHDGGGLWRVAGCAAIVAVEAAHASFVVAPLRRGDRDALRAVAGIAVGAGIVSGAGGILPLSGLVPDDRFDDGYAQLLGVLLIVQLLCTAVGPLLRRLDRTQGEPPVHEPLDPAQRLAREVAEAADRIERLAPDPRVRAECERLRRLVGER
jgi:hypothetical protein